MKQSKQSSISAFFGGKPAPPKATAPVTTDNASAATKNQKENKPGAEETTPPAEDGSPVPPRQLKRLRRAVITTPSKDDEGEAGLEDDDDALAKTTAVSIPMAFAPAVASPSPAKRSAAAASVSEESPAAKKAKPEVQPLSATKTDKGSTHASPLKPSIQTLGKALPSSKPAASNAPAKAAKASNKVQAGAPSMSPAASGGKAAKDEDEDVDMEDEDDMEEASEEDEAALGAAAPAFKKAIKAAPKMKPIASKVEGVGLKAIEAAGQHGSFDLAALATWEPGTPVPYTFLANTFEAIAGTTKRLQITSMLVCAFRAIIATTPQDLLPTVYLCTDKVAPAHHGIELGVGESILIKALAQATGRSDAVIKKDYATSGDLGTVAVNARATQRTMFQPAPLTIASVFKTFKEISLASGANSQDRKRGLITKLLVAAKGNEAGYIMRSLQGKLRIGLAEQTVLSAVAHAVLLQKEKASGSDLADKLERAAQIVKVAYSECPSYDQLIPALLDHPIPDLPQYCHFMPGVPIKPMLAKATTGVGEVLDKFSDCEFTCEYKYDGERAQIHVLEDGTVQVYSRNSENNTSKYPDVVARIPGLLKEGVKSIVIDSEVVAWDMEKKRILPFQVLSTRPRKDVKVEDLKVQVCIFAFDCLYLNGRVLLREPLTQRREALYSSLVEREEQLMFAVAKTSRDVEELGAFLNDSVEHGTEGLIVKTMDATYEPARRSNNWLKLKKDYLEGVGDTFDVVPIGAWYGKGKRTGVFGAYLIAVYDPADEAYQTISKVGTGFSEEVLKELADQMKEHTIECPRSYYRYGEGQTPDVWFEPVKVWEVKAADLSISPMHCAAMGLVDPDKGISIRFPRLLRVRDDKGPEDATTAEQVADMYRAQAIVRQQQKGKADAEDDDF